MNLHFESADEDGTISIGESVAFSSTINGVEEEDDQSMDADSAEVEQGTRDSDGSIEASKEGKDELPCEFCGQVPCNVVNYWGNICEICDDLRDNREFKLTSFCCCSSLTCSLLRQQPSQAGWHFFP